MGQFPSGRIVVAIPAKDEAERIGNCLNALARQSRLPDVVLLLANNCSDDTCAIARGLAASLPYQLVCKDHVLPSPGAGYARRLAMQHAAAHAGNAGILLTTDADAIAADEWVERNLAALQQGADLVCGRVEVDSVEAGRIPAHLHADDALECELIRLQDRMVALLDPDPADPWPRHAETAGASLAVRAEAFQRIGGIPALASGEDRAFAHALARVDARIRHASDVRATVSCRIDGRAAGGMADTIRRRIQQQDEFTDECVEVSADAWRRADFRRRVRVAWQTGSELEELAVDLGVPGQWLRACLTDRYFGNAWHFIQARSPFLTRRRVRFVDLQKQITSARQLLVATMVAEVLARA